MLRNGNKMKIAFVCTNFNNSRYSEEMVASINVSSDFEVLIIIVDNNSEKDELNLLKSIEERNKHVRVIYNDLNVGYFGGLNIGLEYLNLEHSEYDHVVIGNNDLLFSPSFLNMITLKSDLFTKYPVISPNIITIDGFNQNPHVIKRISKVREFIYDLYYSNYYLAGLIKQVSQLTNSFTDRKDEQQHEVAQEIYQGYGACYILGPLYFQQFEQLWAPTFLSYEEFFLSRQLQEKGYKIFYEPSIKLQHHWHAAMNKVPGKQRWNIARDSHKIYRKYIKVWSS